MQWGAGRESEGRGRQPGCQPTHPLPQKPHHSIVDFFIIYFWLIKGHETQISWPLYVGPTTGLIARSLAPIAREMGGGAMSAIGADRGHARPTKRAYLAAGAACVALLGAWMAAVGPQGVPTVPGAVDYCCEASGAAAGGRSALGDGRARACAGGRVSGIKN